MAGAIKISATIATKNEEHNLANCLRSVRDWVDEIVIVDDASTDRTVEIAAAYTDKVFIHNSGGNFHKNKNLAIEKASGEWILTLDADEVVSEELSAEIRSAIDRSDKNGYYINRKNYFMGKWIKHCGWYPDYILRLFRKASGARWPLEIHDVPKINDPQQVGYLNSPLIHNSYVSYEQYFDKFNRYTTRLAYENYQKNLRIDGLPDKVYYLFLKPAYYFFKKYVLMMGFADGIEGFFISVSSALVTFITYLKLMELYKQKSDNR